MDVKLIWIFLLVPFVIFVAWIALKYFDEPVRAWLTRRCGIKPSSRIKLVTASSGAERPLENTMGRTSKGTRCSAGRILMLVLALTVPIFAQEESTSAIWRGLVKNSVGTPIVGAKVG
jgi:hypothetical protein